MPSALDNRVAEGYWAAKRTAALADRSELGRISMAGKDSLDLLHRLSTQDLLPLKPGQGAQTVLTTDKGRILDVATVYVQAPDRLLLVTSAERQADVLAWLDRFTFNEDSSALDISSSTALVSVLGPRAPAIVEGATGKDPSSLAPFGHMAAGIAGSPVVVARGQEPVGGFHLIVLERDALDKVRAALLMSGMSEGLKTLAPEAYESLRVEAGIGLFGKELGEQYNPLEAQLRDSISFRKGCYIGQEVIARLDAYEKVQKLLMGVLLPEDEPPSPGTKLLVDAREAGTLTSVAFSPSLRRPIGLAYIAFKHAVPGTALTLAGSGAPAEAVALPFKTS